MPYRNSAGKYSNCWRRKQVYDFQPPDDAECSLPGNHCLFKIKHILS